MNLHICICGDCEIAMPLDHCKYEIEVERLRRLLTDPDIFWNAIYPHITEAGPDLNGADCEEICRWLRTALEGQR